MARALPILLAVSLFAGIGILDLSAQEEDTPRFTEEDGSFYGYVTDYLDANIYESGPSTDAGNTAYLRLKGDFKPQENLAFHLEAVYWIKTGNQNPYLLMQSYGLAPVGSPSKTQELAVDHAWGMATFGTLDLQLGKVPLGWGTGYVFNPTQRAAVLSSLDPVVEETPGTLAFQPTWSIFTPLTLSGYLAFQDKSHRDTVAVQDGRWENLPFGVKVQVVLGSFDFSTSLIKEVLYLDGFPGNYRRSWFVGADSAGAIWNFGVYAEAALRLPTNRAGTAWDSSSFDLIKALEAVVGVDYTFSGIDLELRAEYYHQGPGETDTTRYDILKVLGGEQQVLGQDYLFGRLSKAFGGNHEANLSGLVNLHDRSFGVLPELVLDAYDNLQITLGASLFWGQAGSEFNGMYDLGAGAFDVTPLSISAKVKLSF